VTHSHNHSGFRNNLLSLLSEEDRNLLQQHLEAIDLPKRFVIAEPDQPIQHVYFVETGLGSMVARSPEGQEVETGIFGRDSVAPVSVILGSDKTPHRHFMQVSGTGHRMAADKLVTAMNISSSLGRLFLRYAQVYTTQTSFTALSNAIHPLNERLARWILMSHDRCDSDDIPLTHEFLSLMLAVRRPSVTTALHVLEGSGFIRSERGYITVRNRQALEEFASDAYGKPEAEYRRLIGPL